MEDSSRTGVIKPVPDAIPAALREQRNWVIWQLEGREGSKPTKRPYNARNLRPASTTDPKTWSGFSEALTAYQRGGWDGIGFVLTAADEFTVLDLDGCRDPETGEIETWAETIIHTVDSYTEVSQSGRGIHLFVRAKLPVGGRRKGKLEAYSSARFIAVTGQRLEGTPEGIEQRQEAIEALHAAHFSSVESPRMASSSTSAGATLEDDDVIELASRGANGEKFGKLFNGVKEDYGGDHSRADQALCNILAFYTKDEAQIDRIFRRSDLNREKWEREHYRSATIGKAIRDTPETYGGSNARATLKGGRKQENESTEKSVRYRLTDYGNSERFVDQHAGTLIFVEEFQAWYAWNQTVWEPSRGAALERAKQTARAVYDEASSTDDPEERAKLARHAINSETGRALREMASLAASDPRIAVKSDALDADLWVLNTPSGILNLRTGALEPHDPQKFCTRITRAAFDPGAPCPIFEGFVSRIFGGDTELIAFVQRAIGSALVGENLDQKMFILNGNGANGKSTLLSAVSYALGEYARTTPSETLMWKRERGIPNDLAALKGARFVVSSEGSEGRRLAEDLVKLVTGGDKVAARFMRGEFFEFTPQFSLFFQTNHLPTVSGNDYGIWRRLAVVPFAVTIPPEQRDAQLSEKLRDEASGILAWAVRGCLEWQRLGLGMARAVEEAGRQYREDSDALRDFLLERCDVGPSLDASAADLYSSYQNWSLGRGEHPVTMIVFSRRLTERGFQKHRSTGGKLKWSGVKLRPSSHDGEMRLIPTGRLQQVA